jgi:hypothetical protein
MDVLAADPASGISRFGRARFAIFAGADRGARRKRKGTFEPGDDYKFNKPRRTQGW